MTNETGGGIAKCASPVRIGQCRRLTVENARYCGRISALRRCSSATYAYSCSRREGMLNEDHVCCCRFSSWFRRLHRSCTNTGFWEGSGNFGLDRAACGGRACFALPPRNQLRSEEHTSELQSLRHL